jgi:UDP-2-acetamido-3-amino-2,3-dideoxy-glucuronate N-acetyltransferase
VKRASDVFVHASSVVDEACEIGEGTKIWHFCHLMAARIGARCSLGQNVFVASGVVVGDGVRVQNNVSLYEGVTIEADVFIGPSAVFTNVRNPRAAISRHGHYQPTRLRRGCTIGANATVMCGCTIGRHAFVAAGAVVTHDVDDYALMMGVPARRVGWMSRHGQRLLGLGLVRCAESGLRYEVSETQVRCLDLDEDAPLTPSRANPSSR